MRNFYSVSISGYHIAEAGANPLSQLAFTLANGFTYVEAYRARGMRVDDFAPNLSFFFSNGMDAEYAVIGRVARRIWSIAMRDVYGASERSQKLKYHTQTSGRSLHAQEIDFNDIRTTLQALIGVYDNCNSQHTNAYDEAITTALRGIRAPRDGDPAHHQSRMGAGQEPEPEPGLVHHRRADRSGRGPRCCRSSSGSPSAVVYSAPWRPAISAPGSRKNPCTTKTRKHDGTLPIVGVNTFRNPRPVEAGNTIQLARSTAEEKQSQLKRLRDFQRRHQDAAPAALQRLQEVAMANGNVFAELMHAVRSCSLGQITNALFEVGGQYRRNM